MLYEIKDILKGHEVEVYDIIDSTNDRAKLLASEGAPSGTVVVSDTQRRGRGQKGRSFYSQSGSGLYMSIVLRPEIPMEESMKITAYAAVATAEAIESLVPCDVKIKWVNDLYLNGRKICGILTEGATDCGRLKYAVLGIGINTGKMEFPCELCDIATSVFNETGIEISRSALACEIVKRLESADDSYMERYRSRSCVIGKRARVVSGNREFEAEIIDIAKNGFLVVRSDSGIFTVNSGEVIMRCE